jgi:predicted RND superfamily exporter protein/outer membrane lipoprotein-sorting protein
MFARYIVRYHWAVLIFILALTAYLASSLGRLNIVIDDAKILPQTHPYVVATNKIESIFGQKYTVVVTITPRSGDIFQSNILRKIAVVSTALENTEGVVPGRVRSLSTRQTKSIYSRNGDLVVERIFDADVGKVDPDAIKSRLAKTVIYDGILVSRDHKVATVLAEFKAEPRGYKILAAKIQTATDKIRGDDVEIHVGGQPIILGAVESYGERLNFLIPIAILIIGLLHWEAFRTFQGFALPLVTAILAVVWALGLMAKTGVALDPFNSLAPIVILAVAAGHAVQILKRFYEDYEVALNSGTQNKEAAKREAIVSSLSHTGAVMICAGTIASASFLSLVVFMVSSIRSFGIITASGVMSALILELTFIPAVRTLLPPPRNIAKRTRTVIDAITEGLAEIVLNRRRRLFVVAGACVALLGIGVSGLQLNNSLRANITADQPVRKDDAYINKLAGANTLYVLLEGKGQDAIKNPAVMAAMAKLQAHLEKLPGVGRTLSIADYVRTLHGAISPGAATLAAIPSRSNLISQYLLLYSLSGDPGDFDSFVDNGYQRAVIAVFLREESSRFLENLKTIVSDDFRETLPSDVTFSLGGTITNPASLNEVIVTGKIRNIALIAAVLFLFSSFLFRSPLAGALVSLPLAATVLANYGIMGWSGIPLQMATATVSAMAVGIGADYAIYFAYRLREEIESRPHDIPGAVRETYRTAGQAVIYIATAIIGGYSVLMLSYGFMVHFWLGLLVTLSMFVSATCALTIFPALLLVTRPASIFGPRGERHGERSQHKLLSIGLALCICSGFTARARAAEPTADEIMRSNYAASRTADATYRGRLALVTEGGDLRVRDISVWTKLLPNDNDMSRLTRFTSPADIKGTATLTVENSAGDDSIWIYLPAMGKIRRLVASNKKDSYVGTDLSYGDVIGYRTSEWKNTIVGTAEVDGAQCWVVESVPASEKVAANFAYSKRIGWIRRDNFVTAKGELYDVAGKMQKTFVQTNIRKVSDRPAKWQPMHIEVHNIQTHHTTRVDLTEFEANTGISDRIFLPNSLENGG